MLKIGVLGTGHLGKIHLKCIQLAVETYDLVGFYDPNPAMAKAVAEQFNIRAFASVEALIQAVDVVDIVTPTTTHFALAVQVIQAGKHVFIEKPLTHTIAEAEELIRLSKEYGVQVQVGHVERFNPALLALENTDLNPMFIEAHRLAAFNPRGTDVSVVLDLMIHDLDIVLSMVDAKPTKVSANGVAVVSETPDIANARIEFDNGCVANLTASRISMKQMRKVRFFQRDAYISLDFLEKNAQVVRLYDQDAANLPENANLLEWHTPQGVKMLHIDMPPIESVNAIKMELESFADSIVNHTTPKVSIEDGYQALKLAYEIIREIDQGSWKVDLTKE
ncbi:Gfo/Idh/MocA family protein [Haliscomenobacter hydrossis]|uniref:Oxidoreductase domain protein n=1 Tax=Haliscomenobacter hydrossis (strain ATCC 27775 / DSM 1100 / LMG 10767 / O) TaxID=760192 RepID=F4KV45_HALH1|nr:Gfo/Idh/MocA family oxidoreductase [Haliscomenobacter hydrossis]AEE49211.1 oxidoreductase domain protein [Haliscomenobacter hydrossis DSM 1100]